MNNSNIDKAIRDLEEKNPPLDITNNSVEIHRDDEEIDRLKRMEQIRDQANNERLARCEAKKKEVGESKFMDLIHSGEWNDSEGMTEIKKEYVSLMIKQRNCEWIRDHDDKPYRVEDDPSAKF